MGTLNSIRLVARTAFSIPLHLIIGSITGIVFWVVTNRFDNILFFSPFLAFYVPSDMFGIFFLSCINSILVGILVNFNLHIMRNLKLRMSKSLYLVLQLVLFLVHVLAVLHLHSQLLQLLVD